MKVTRSVWNYQRPCWIHIRPLPDRNKIPKREIRKAFQKEKRIDVLSKIVMRSGKIPGSMEGKAANVEDKIMRFAIVVAKFNSLITKSLLEGAMAAFNQFNVSDSSVDVESHCLKRIDAFDVQGDLGSWKL